MNGPKRFSISLAALLLFSSVGMVAQASARDGSISSGESSTSGSSVATATGSDDSTNDEMGNANQLSQQFKQQAKEKLQTARTNAKEQTEAHRQKSCEARKANLTKRMNNAVQHSTNHKAVFDKIYTRVKQFYTDKQLNVTNYDQLTANVDTAQSKAADSITALKALNVNVDCSSQTVADSVSTFQQAVASTRDSLKAYRKSIVTLITALKGASTSASSSSGSDSNTNSTTTE